jgi:dTDP-4-amino-4,6-dideoxygalactose transaminase
MVVRITETVRTDVRKTMLPFSPPLIGEEEINEVVDTLRSDWLTCGPKTRRFEQEFAGYVDRPAALALNSGTAALQVALAAAGIGPGDEVITSTMTFCSTVHAIEQSGARPVLVDVEPDTLNLDPSAVERALTARTRAIIPVHLYGHPAEMNALLAIVEGRRVFVLEDAAHALPASYHSRMVGTLGDAAAFSFYATKNLTTGDGGMLVGDSAFIESARPWSLHGMTRDAHQAFAAADNWSYDVVLPGFKCNMTDIQAAIGLPQLAKIDRHAERRREIASRYEAALKDVPHLQAPIERSHVRSAWHLYPIRLHLAQLTVDRRTFIQELQRRNISAGVHFIPVHLLHYYREKYGFKPDDFPVAHREFQRIVTLPLNLRMTDQDVDDVIEAVSDVISVAGLKACAATDTCISIV